MTGPYVKVLDAGDLLTPGLGRPDLAALKADPTLGRATSRALDRPPDGFPVDPEEGWVDRSAVLDHWAANDFLTRVHPATLRVRRVPLPASEAAGLLYRKQESQAAHVNTLVARTRAPDASRWTS
ncbi:hypothetical protein ACIRJM_13420 [Streptomyces sp. NPDC102405]|uniref:hypothetical protein n=1 Tax=Streptomyces sp. NPDC102405 TaxID=3366170 RepID=UPI00380476C5